MKKVKNNETGTVEWILELLKEMGVVYVDDIRHYKFRDECEHDVNELRMELGWRCVKIVKTVEYYFPDVVVDLYTTLSLEEIKDEIRKINDGHVMLQTVELAENYTGERNFEIK
jgi:hypothetical protein